MKPKNLLPTLNYEKQFTKSKTTSQVTQSRALFRQTKNYDWKEFRIPPTDFILFFYTIRFVSSSWFWIFKNYLAVKFAAKVIGVQSFQTVMGDPFKKKSKIYIYFFLVFFYCFFLHIKNINFFFLNFLGN